MTSQATSSVLGVVVAIVAFVATDGLAAQSRFENATAGISLAPPAGWHVMSMQSVMDNRAKVRLPDDQLTAGLQRATAPLFVFSKYPESYPALNPTVQVVLRPTPASLGPSPTAIMKATISTLQQAFPDFRLVDPIQATKVSGFPAAYMKATYTLRTAKGTAFPVMARTWVVPRDKVMFLIGMSGTVSGDDVCEAEFRSALESIRIEQ